ncbi:ATP-binding protein [Kordiimonas pumila]|uniref:histidine kinase n=1 Tax=Kordiimonas pumila TaxID=2161677 RepID=A0ABV7D0Q8_9PROT|nr:ATP-binding protein [Kordiimonas pumila]
MKPVAIVSNPVRPVGPEATCGMVYERFTEDTSLVAIAVVERGRPIGLLKRLDFLTKLADRYGRPLYEAKPVTYLMDSNPAMVEETDCLDNINSILVSAEGEAMQHGFIVLDNGFYKGIGTATTVLKNNMALMEQRLQDLENAQVAAEAANRAKTQFLANMSHELRTPLNAVIGFSEFLLSEASRGRTVNDLKSYIEDIRLSGVHLLQVINSILDMSKIEAGAFELKEGYIYVDELLDQVTRLMEGMALTKGIQIKAYDIPSDSELCVDVQVIKQALMNLLSNAIKFSTDGSQVCIMFSQPSAEEIQFCVCDTGPGLSEADIAQVMKPFVQIEAEHNRRYEGSGLGLPLVKAFAEAHGGRLHLESSRGKGVQASIFLPSTRLQHSKALLFAI